MSVVLSMCVIVGGSTSSCGLSLVQADIVVSDNAVEVRNGVADISGEAVVLTGMRQRWQVDMGKCYNITYAIWVEGLKNIYWCVRRM